MLYFGDVSGEMAERSKATVSKIVVGATPPRVRIPLSPPFFLPPSDSLNQSQFAQPSLKPVDTNGFTKHIAVCLKHTQTPGSGRFSGKIHYCPVKIAGLD